jgi:F-type H+-transporting ATPase subunit c
VNRFFHVGTLGIVLLLLVWPALVHAEAAEEAPAKAEQEVAGETPARSAQPAAAAHGFSIYLGVAFGCGMIILGAGYGISKIGSCAVESMARQPEVAAPINTAMIISAALIEGVTFFALIVCLIRLFTQE